MHDNQSGCGTGRPRDPCQEVAEGLLYAHRRLNANTSKTLEAASFFYALAERIWLDFENRVVNPGVNQPDWPQSLILEEVKGRDNAKP